jgi:phospholipase C
MRVPAVIVSPYIKPRTVLRAAAGGYPFDHTSIIATLRKRFSIGAP